MSKDAAADTCELRPVADLPPRVAYEVIRVVEDVLLAPIDDADGVREALGSLEGALLAPSAGEHAMLEAVHRLEESVRSSIAEERSTAAAYDGRARPAVASPGEGMGSGSRVEEAR